MAHVPGEIIRDILTRLPFTSVLRFRSVCKIWRDMIDEFQFKSDPTLIFMPYVDWDALYLVQFGQNAESTTTRINFTCPVVENDYYPLYANGLCCFYPRDHCLAYCSPYSYNLVTHESIKLPHLNILEAEEFLQEPGFGFDSSSQTHKLVLLNYGHANILTLGSTSWRKLDHALKVTTLTENPAMVNGSLHWITGAECVLSFDLSFEKFEFIAFPQSLPPTSRYNYEVVNLGDCLCIADMSPEEHIELWIMKLYKLKDSWTKLIIKRSYADHIRLVRPGCFLYQVLPICIWRKREILLIYGYNTLVSYDIQSAQYTRLRVDGISLYKISKQHCRRRKSKTPLMYNVYGM